MHLDTVVGFRQCGQSHNFASNSHKMTDIFSNDLVKATYLGSFFLVCYHLS